ncbi:hypothetical protein MTR_3g463980 [Medicago truncatula]|uniref:Uncharacterized protein n=1 Tax=Medicago truncatula TaxID=3880 RepID=A0A072UXH6_MEDTR|nr:hypothetical protein MTR_3g463980 [Medicago truncatula]
MNRATMEKLRATIVEEKFWSNHWKNRAMIGSNCATMKTDSNMTPSCWEVYQKTHKMKGDPSKWVFSKSQMVVSENFIFLDVVGVVNKKGRIYGLGVKAGKYEPSSSRSSDVISPSEYEHMRTAISKMSAENMELKERLKTNEELICASQEESRLVREQSQED